MTYKLSPTSLNLMQECRRCFWLSQHKIWWRPRGIFPSLPNGMDRILKEHFDKFMKGGEVPPELCDNNECEGMKLFNDEELLEEWRNARKGLVWEDEKGNILHGALDGLLQKNKKLIVLDYKTRGSDLNLENGMPDYFKVYKNQLGIYSFLLRKNGYETEDYAFLLFYFPKEVLETGEMIFNTRLVKIDFDIKNVEELFNKALEFLDQPCPTKAQGCEWCCLFEGEKENW